MMVSYMGALRWDDSADGDDEWPFCPDEIADVHIASGVDAEALPGCFANFMLGDFRVDDRLREAWVLKNFVPCLLRQVEEFGVPSWIVGPCL